MSITNTFIRTIKIFAGIGLLEISACSSNIKQENQAAMDTAIAVTIAIPSSGQQEGLNVSGQIESAQSANISTRVMGYITKLNVKVGDRVSKGQLLATISNDDILAKRAQADAMISEAEVAAKNAQKDYDRFSVLYKQQSASAKDLDNVTQQYSSANLTAPFAGTVTQKLMDAGSMANPGMTILTIEQSGSYQVSASVPETMISQVREGANAIITLNAINKVIKGNITQVNQSSQFSGGQYLIKISIPDGEKQGLFAGMYANVSIPVKQTTANKTGEDQVMVPINAIEYKDQLTGIYTVGNNNTALLRWVRLGKVEEGQVEVLSGLAPHEQFIVSADGRLFNGAAVKINK